MTKNKPRLKVLLTGVLLLANLVHAQESTNTSGSDATGSGGIVAYSVGQVAYTTHTASTGSVAQGVQHAYEIISLGIVDTVLSISLFVFPNPTRDNLTLQIRGYNNEKLSYQLYDLRGKLLNDEEVFASKTQISTASLANATYFLHVVSQDKTTIQSFKIIKTQ